MSSASTFFSHYPLHVKYSENEWYSKINNYFTDRFSPIANRLNSTFRYVDLHPKNKDAFSYEYTSLLRDIGSTFSSVLDSFLTNIQGKKKYNIDHFRKFLLEEITELETVMVILSKNLAKRWLFPFEGFAEKKIRSTWWRAYNDVKHKDIYRLEAGNLSNVLYSFGALSVLYSGIVMTDNVRRDTEGIIGDIRDITGYYDKSRYDYYKAHVFTFPS